MVDNIRRGVCDRLPPRHGTPQRAIGFPDIGTKYVTTTGTDGLVARHARNALGRTVKARDMPVLVHRKNALVNGIKNGGFTLGWGYRLSHNPCILLLSSPTPCILLHISGGFLLHLGLQQHSPRTIPHTRVFCNAISLIPFYFARLV